MQVTSSGIETARGSSDWFTGVVYIETIAVLADSSRLGAAACISPPARGPRGTSIRTGRRSGSSKASAFVSGEVTG